MTSQYGDAMYGYSMDTPISREAFIRKLINMLFDGMKSCE